VIDELIVCIQSGVKWLSSRMKKVAAMYGEGVRRESFK
jgi:hypothetical protein